MSLLLRTVGCLDGSPTAEIPSAASPMIDDSPRSTCAHLEVAVPQFIDFSTLSPRRTSSSSSSNSDFSSETEATSSQSSEEPIPLVKHVAEEVISRGTHPFATLGELCNVKIMGRPSTSFNSVVGGWACTISVDGPAPDLSFEASAIGTGKQAAKKMASQMILDQLTYYLNIPTFVANPLPPPVMSTTIPNQPSTHGVPTPNQVKQLAGDIPHMERLRDIQQAMRTSSQSVACVSLDIEMYDRDHSIILEVGVSTMQLGGQANPPILSRHFIIQENADILNGKYCPNNKYNFRPEFGVSQSISATELSAAMTEILNHAAGLAEKVFLVGHSIHGDIEWLKQHCPDLDSSKLEQCDIARCYRSLIARDQFVNIIGMEAMMARFQLDCSFAHNGGNDARYNLHMMLAILEMISKEEDEQMVQDKIASPLPRGLDRVTTLL